MPDNTPPSPLEELITHLRRLPGVGRRSAERYAYSMIEWDKHQQQELGNLIATLSERIAFCESCGALLSGETCEFCNNPRRDQETICIIEHFSQIPIIERSGCYKGLYHILGGHLQPLEGKGPESLRLAPLLQRLDSGTIREVILALNPDIEGEATAAWLIGELASYGIATTRIASGVPAGADLSYADAATMALAITRRQNT